VQSVLGQFHNEFNMSISALRRASSGKGKSRNPLADARHYVLFDFEDHRPNHWRLSKLWKCNLFTHLFL